MTIDFDFGVNFASVATRVADEAARRTPLAARAMAYNMAFLDDVTRGILPHDVILVGAMTCACKTTLVNLIAETSAQAGKRVHFFALEAEPDEIERHLKYRAIAHLVWRDRVLGASALTYPDWYLGRCADLVAPYEDEAEMMVRRNYGTLHTYYRGANFGESEISRLFLAIQDQTDLIILDHLHYVDTDAKLDENRSYKDIVKTIRTLALSIGVPIILVAHLRKRPTRKMLIPALEDFHGSSDITKIATRAIMIAPARDRPSAAPWVAATYMAVVKDRLCGETGMTALCGFDLRTVAYEPSYRLGRMDIMGETWTPLDEERRPKWATRAL